MKEPQCFFLPSSSCSELGSGGGTHGKQPADPPHGADRVTPPVTLRGLR